MISFFRTIVYEPLYNGLIFFVDVAPWLDTGIVVILFTILIKLILLPLSLKAVRTQIKMKAVAPKLEEIKEKYKEDKQEQAKATMELYKNEKINPFSSIFLILIQIPIIFSLYWVFKAGFEVNPDILYSFVPEPGNIDTMFLGLIDISQRSFILAILAAVTSFFQIRLSVPPVSGPKEGEERTFKHDLAKSMNVQMRYFFPIIVLFISFSIPGAVAIYWATSNMFIIFQELYVRKRYKKHENQ